MRIFTSETGLNTCHPQTLVIIIVGYDCMEAFKWMPFGRSSSNILSANTHENRNRFLFVPPMMFLPFQFTIFYLNFIFFEKSFFFSFLFDFILFQLSTQQLEAHSHTLGSVNWRSKLQSFEIKFLIIRGSTLSLNFVEQKNWTERIPSRNTRSTHKSIFLNRIFSSNWNEIFLGSVFVSATRMRENEKIDRNCNVEYEEPCRWLCVRVVAVALVSVVTQMSAMCEIVLSVGGKANAINNVLIRRWRFKQEFIWQNPVKVPKRTFVALWSQFTKSEQKGFTVKLLRHTWMREQHGKKQTWKQEVRTASHTSMCNAKQHCRIFYYLHDRPSLLSTD